MLSSATLQLINTIKLPALDREPGPLHTILQIGNDIYYTDEVNHSLVSLDISGQVRWHHTKRGKGPGEFHYPKGIDVGLINDGGSQRRCIAVCDSWNQRIQFFGLDGIILTEWIKAGDLCISEPVDIRFICNADQSGSDQSCWIVLDRGHHLLLGLDTSGRPLFKIGRAFPENLEKRWKTPADVTDQQTSPEDRLRQCLPYDPLFMPRRIFGNTQEALFIWESKAHRIKQVMFGNLMPVCIDLPPGAEWICADENGLLCFNKSEHSMGFYETDAKRWRSIAIQGTPVFSCRPSRDIWTQDDLNIHRWNRAVEQKDHVDLLNLQPWIVRVVADEVQDSLWKWFESTEALNLQKVTANLCEWSNSVLKITEDNGLDLSALERARENITELSNSLIAAMAEIKEFALFIFLGFLKVQILRSMYPRAESRPYLRQAQERIESATEPIENLFKKMLLFRDDWLIARLVRGYPRETDTKQIHENLLQECYQALMVPVRELAHWQWHSPFFDSINRVLENACFSNHEARIFNSCLADNSIFSSKTKHLREIDRIRVGESGDAECKWPLNICHDPCGGFWVSLRNTNQILRLKENGQVLGQIELPNSLDNPSRRPHGIAVDDANCIWLTLPQENRVEIVNLTKNQTKSLEHLAGKSLNLKYPTGICAASNGQMLIADTQNSRIMTASKDGRITSLVNREGKNLGELKHPVAFCCIKQSREFWAVEIRNHRLQRFDLNGKSLGTIGKAGLREGQFVLPETISIFDDGMLIVGQHQVARILKLLSDNGDELETIQLGYSAAGILAHNNLLLVCEGMGSHIRVYERI